MLLYSIKLVLFDCNENDILLNEIIISKNWGREGGRRNWGGGIEKIESNLRYRWTIPWIIINWSLFLDFS